MINERKMPTPPPTPREREKEEREKIETSKYVQTTPFAPAASATGPCPTIIQIVGRPGTGSLPRTIAPPDQPLENRYNAFE